MSEASAAYHFDAFAFAENFSLKELAERLATARLEAGVLRLDLPEGGELFAFPFGAVVFRDVERERRRVYLSKVPRAGAVTTPPAAADVVREDFIVRVEPASGIAFEHGALRVDRLDGARAGVVALTVAQSAAMEYYERIVERLFDRTNAILDDLGRRGTVPLATRPLHRFIAEAMGTRNEVLAVLHLLDKPDAVWDDSAMDLIYDDLRAEFDLVDRFEALETKLRAVQEALGLLLESARDRRLVLLEVAVVGLIVLELVLSIFRRI